MVQKSILTVSLSKHITGEPIADVLETDWKKATDAERAAFNHPGFDVNPNDVPKMLTDLKSTLHGREWDGVLVGWCSRGYPERTELYEEIMKACIDEARVQKDMKLIFNTGPEDLYEPVIRNFPDVVRKG